jgi:chromosome segregation ATPase
VAANQSTEQPRANDETKQTLAALQQTVNDLQSARQRDEGQIADLQRQLSAEQGERKLLSDQVGALAGRVDGLEKARAEFTGPANRRRGR